MISRRACLFVMELSRGFFMRSRLFLLFSELFGLFPSTSPKQQHAQLRRIQHSHFEMSFYSDSKTLITFFLGLPMLFSVLTMYWPVPFAKIIYAYLFFIVVRFINIIYNFLSTVPATHIKHNGKYPTLFRKWIVWRSSGSVKFLGF